MQIDFDDLCESDIDLIKKEINLILKTLDDRKIKIIKKRFWENKTYQEIGDEYRVTRERSRQILLAAFRDIRKPSRRRRILDLIEGKI